MHRRVPDNTRHSLKIMETLPQYLARVLCSRTGTRKRFSMLHTLYLEQEQHIMATNTTSGMSVSSDVPVSVKQVDHNALEGANKGNHLSPNTAASADALKGNDRAPRAETNDQPKGTGA